MLRLALRTLRFRKGGLAASFAALFLGVLIVTACGGLMETGIRADAPPRRLAGAPVVVTGDQSYRVPKSGDAEHVTLPERVRLAPELVDAVRAVPGVGRAVPDVSFPVAVLGPDGRGPLPMPERPAGHGWSSASLAPYTLTAGREPGSHGEVVLDVRTAAAVGARPGGTVDLAVRGTVERFGVAGLAAGRPELPAGVFFSDPDVRRIAPRQIDALAVFPVPGTGTGELAGRISAALAGHDATVATGGDRGHAEFTDVRPAGEVLIVLAAVFGGLAIMVVVFVAASTLGLSVQQRQRETALLRIIGATPGQLRRMVLGEAVVAAAAAAALARPLGPRAGRALFGQITGHDVVPAEIAFRQGWIPPAAAAGAALLTAVVAALVAVHGAATARPARTLVQASLLDRRLGPLRIGAALVCLCGAFALMLVTAIVLSGPVAASTAGPSAMLWAAGLALLAPLIVPVVAAALRPALRALPGNAGYLALLNVRARRDRTAAALTPVMLATGLATGLIYLQTSQAADARHVFADSLRADAVVTSSTGGVPLGLVDTVRATPGVAAASALVTSTGFVETPRLAGQSEDGLELRGVSPEGAGATTAVTVTAGALTDLRDDTVALDVRHARRIGGGVGVGDTVTFRLGDGAKAGLRVVALFTTRTGPATVLMPAPLLARHTTAGMPAEILVRAAPGAGRGRLAAALSARVSDRPGVRVAGRDEAVAAQAEQERTGASVNYLFVAVIIGYTVITLVNTLIIAAAERRREFALQRIVGADRDRLLRMITVEGLIVAFSGVLLGCAVAALTLVPFGIALNGSPVPGGPPWIFLTVVGSASALTLVVTLLSSRAAMRPHPAEVMASPA
ncbi:ABC transporter permease [Actinomadura sp. K4S16]|uniref:ABC transporter permease n=1 Tax=Actinomadura sp. K4S16 TaxID=1316147 RepID=UPI0011ECB5AA|nr:ABC transporter permease [Actinomadura sp. K4S16]